MQTIEEAEKTELAQKGKGLVEDLGKTAQKTAEAVSKQSEQISKTAVFRSVSHVSV